MIDESYLDTGGYDAGTGGSYDFGSFDAREDWFGDLSLTGVVDLETENQVATTVVANAAVNMGIDVPRSFLTDRILENKDLSLSPGPGNDASPGLFGGIFDFSKSDPGLGKDASPGLLGGIFDFSKSDPFMKQALVMTLLGAVGSGVGAVVKASSDEKLMDKKIAADQTLVQTQADIRRQQIEANKPGRIKRTEAATLLTPDSWKTDPLKMTQSGIVDRQKGVPYGRPT